MAPFFKYFPMTQDDTQGSYGQRGFNQLVFLNQTQVSAPLGSSCFLHGDSCLLPLPPVGPHRLSVVYHWKRKTFLMTWVDFFNSYKGQNPALSSGVGSSPSPRSLFSLSALSRGPSCTLNKICWSLLLQERQWGIFTATETTYRSHIFVLYSD